MGENGESYKGMKSLCGGFATIGGLMSIATAISEGGLGAVTRVLAISTGALAVCYIYLDGEERDYSQRTLENIEKTLKGYLKKSE